MNKKGVATLFKLSIPSPELKKDYVTKYIDGLKNRIKIGVIEKKKDGSISKSYKLSDAAKNILLPNWDNNISDENILKGLLKSEPLELKKLNDSLSIQLNAIPNASDRPSKELLSKIFGYETIFNSSSKSDAYWLSKQIDSNTCVYCNRQYAFTIEKKDGKNKKERLVRPSFDHWFDKKDYPLMSLSLCNLIPSCTICNSSIKGMTKFDLKTHIHPYVHEPEHPDITFRASLTTDLPYKWTVAIDTPPNSKEEKTVQDMMLQDIYAMHGELEVRDLMNFYNAYPAGYLKQLFENILKDCQCKLNRSEIYSMLFGTEMNNYHFLDRPLSKLKHDILVAIGVLDK